MFGTIINLANNRFHSNATFQDDIFMLIKSLAIYVHKARHSLQAQSGPPQKHGNLIQCTIIIFFTPSSYKSFLLATLQVDS